MKFDTIADIFAGNDKVRAKLTATLSGITPDEETALPDGEKWSIQEIVEHIAMVDHGTSRICAKLVGEAKVAGTLSDGTVRMSTGFGERSIAIAGMKVEAPERVQPTGEVSIPESLARLEASRAAFAAMRDDLERYDLSGPKFPHPFFGEITAAEWLVIAGGHELRHTKQIERLIEKIRQ